MTVDFLNSDGVVTKTMTGSEEQINANTAGLVLDTDYKIVSYTGYTGESVGISGGTSRIHKYPHSYKEADSTAVTNIDTANSICTVLGVDPDDKRYHSMVDNTGGHMSQSYHLTRKNSMYSKINFSYDAPVSAKILLDGVSASSSGSLGITDASSSHTNSPDDAVTVDGFRTTTINRSLSVTPSGDGATADASMSFSTYTAWSGTTAGNSITRAYNHLYRYTIPLNLFKAVIKAHASLGNYYDGSSINEGKDAWIGNDGFTNYDCSFFAMSVASIFSQPGLAQYAVHEAYSDGHAFIVAYCRDTDSTDNIYIVEPQRVGYANSSLSDKVWIRKYSDWYTDYENNGNKTEYPTGLDYRILHFDA